MNSACPALEQYWSAWVPLIIIGKLPKEVNMDWVPRVENIEPLLPPILPKLVVEDWSWDSAVTSGHLHRDMEAVDPGNSVPVLPQKPSSRLTCNEYNYKFIPQLLPNTLSCTCIRMWLDWYTSKATQASAKIPGQPTLILWSVLLTFGWSTEPLDNYV